MVHVTDEVVEEMKYNWRFMHLAFTCPGCFKVPSKKNARFYDEQIKCRKCLKEKTEEEEAKKYKRYLWHELLMDALLDIEKYFKEHGIEYEELFGRADDEDDGTEDEEEEVFEYEEQQQADGGPEDCLILSEDEL